MYRASSSYDHYANLYTRSLMQESERGKMLLHKNWKSPSCDKEIFLETHQQTKNNDIVLSTTCNYTELYTWTILGMTKTPHFQCYIKQNTSFTSILRHNMLGRAIVHKVTPTQIHLHLNVYIHLYCYSIIGTNTPAICSGSPIVCRPPQLVWGLHTAWLE